MTRPGPPVPPVPTTPAYSSWPISGRLFCGRRPCTIRVYDAIRRLLLGTPAPDCQSRGGGNLLALSCDTRLPVAFLIGPGNIALIGKAEILVVSDDDMLMNRYRYDPACGNELPGDRKIFG